MTPAMPPLPTPLYLPFQLSSGSHTSKFTAGEVTPTIRQKAGVPIVLFVRGGVKPFASTTSAEESVVSGRVILVSKGQDCLRLNDC